MALSIIDQPYPWALRGQKLMIIASSDAWTNTGFKYGINVSTSAPGSFTFFLSPAPDSYLYFDLQPLFDTMRNQEPMNYHFSTDDTFNDGSTIGCSFTLQEWWLVDGILTLNAETEISGGLLIVNGYFQVIDGYKPNVQTGSPKVKQSLTNTSSYMMSDRNQNTSPFYLSQTWGFGLPTNSIWIPVLEKDYGVMCIPGNNDWLTNNLPTQFRITIFSSAGVGTQQTIALNNGYNIEALPIYPANLNDWTGLTVKPSLFPNWRCYTVAALNASNGQVSETYIFYNTHDYGQSDCNWDNIRLGWVNSRGGWDYFNFTKKSETTNEIERKTYRKVLFNGSTTVFSANDRGLTQRQNLAQQVLTITSDYITEGEFQLLRSLLVSNQVTWLTEDAGKPVEVPVNIEDTSFVEKKNRDGKQYNVTLRVRLSNPYWT